MGKIGLGLGISVIIGFASDERVGRDRKWALAIGFGQCVSREDRPSMVHSQRAVGQRCEGNWGGCCNVFGMIMVMIGKKGRLEGFRRQRN